MSRWASATRELTEAREKAETLANQSVLALYVLQDGLLKYVNPKTVEMLGYSEDEIASWAPGEFLKVIHEDDRAAIADVAAKKQAGQDEGHAAQLRVAHHCQGRFHSVG